MPKTTDFITSGVRLRLPLSRETNVTMCHVPQNEQALFSSLKHSGKTVNQALHDGDTICESSIIASTISNFNVSEEALRNLHAGQEIVVANLKAPKEFDVFMNRNNSAMPYTILVSNEKKIQIGFMENQTAKAFKTDNKELLYVKGLKGTDGVIFDKANLDAFRQGKISWDDLWHTPKIFYDFASTFDIRRTALALNYHSLSSEKKAKVLDLWLKGNQENPGILHKVSVPKLEEMAARSNNDLDQLRIFHDSAVNDTVFIGDLTKAVGDAVNTEAAKGTGHWSKLGNANDIWKHRGVSGEPRILVEDFINKFFSSELKDKFLE